MLYGFHAHVSLLEVGPLSDHAVVGHKDSVVSGDEGRKRLAQLHGAGGGVGSQWDGGAQGDHHLRAQGFIESNTRGGKPGGGAGVSVDHGAHVGAHAVDSEMHGDLARRVVGAAQLAAAKVRNDHVFRLQHALTETGGRYHHPVRVQTDGEVAGGAGYKSADV